MIIKDYITISISIISLAFSAISLITSQRLQRKSRRIGCDIVDRYHEDNLAIVIVNRGTNPIIIESFFARNNEKQSSKNLIEMMPKVGQNWKGFSLKVVGRVIPVNGEIVLFAIDPIEDQIRKTLLNTMNNMEIEVTYRDISGKRQKKVLYKNSFADFFLRGDYKIGKN